MDVANHKFVPMKVYCDLSAEVLGKESLFTYGKCMEPGLDGMSNAIERIDSTNPPIKFGKLGWWDKLRMKIHGKIALDVKHSIFACTKTTNHPDYFVKSSFVQVDGHAACFKQNVLKCFLANSWICVKHLRGLVRIEMLSNMM